MTQHPKPTPNEVIQIGKIHDVPEADPTLLPNVITPATEIGETEAEARKRKIAELIAETLPL